jgi:hypothetical protein
MLAWRAASSPFCPSSILLWKGLPAVYCCRLCLLKVCKDSCLSPLLWWKGLPTSYCCRLCLLKVHVESSSLPSHLLPCSQSTPPSFLHTLFSSFFIIQFFLWGRGQSVQGALLVYPRGSCGNITCCLFAHLVVCVSQAGLELASGSVGPLLVSQCNVVWEALCGLGIWGCQSFASSWWIFLPSVSPASQLDF